VVALMEKGGHARVHVRRSCGDFYMRCEQCVELHALASKIRRTNRGDLTSQGAQVADRRATWEGHNACVAGGDAWRNAAPEAWGRVRGVGKWHNIIGMRGPAVGGGGFRSPRLCKRHTAACVGRALWSTTSRHNADSNLFKLV
jgi:hypothetical protein